MSSGTAEQQEVSIFLSKAESLYKRALEASFSGAGIDSLLSKEYNKEKGELANERNVRGVFLKENQGWKIGENTGRETERVGEVTGESESRSDSRVQKKVERKFGYEEEVILNAKIKKIKSRLDFVKYENDIYNKNKEIGIDTVFYEDSAIPLYLEVQAEDGGYDGFADVKNKRIYLRSDATISESDLTVHNEHEKLHIVFSQSKENYAKLKDIVFQNLTEESKNSLMTLYDPYVETYKGDMSRVHEEIVVDLIVGRETAEFTNIDIVNDAIDKFVTEFNSKNNFLLEIPSIQEDAKFVKAKTIKLSKSEYAVLRSEVMRKNANSNVQSDIDYAFTANNFYVYENYGEDNFKAVLALKIEGNEDYIDYITTDLRRTNYETDGTSRDFVRRFEVYKNRRKSDSGYNVDVQGRDSENRKNDSVDNRQSKSNSITDTETSSGDNARYVKKLYF